MFFFVAINIPRVFLPRREYRSDGEWKISVGASDKFESVPMASRWPRQRKSFRDSRLARRRCIYIKPVCRIDSNGRRADDRGLMDREKPRIGWKIIYRSLDYRSRVVISYFRFNVGVLRLSFSSLNLLKRISKQIGNFSQNIPSFSFFAHVNFRFRFVKSDFHSRISESTWE